MHRCSDHSSDPPSQLVERVQDLQARLDAAGDPATRDWPRSWCLPSCRCTARAWSGSWESLVEAGERASRLAAALADDPLVAMLLFIHDLHPVPLEVRVAQALEQVRPYMESHGGNVELLSLDQGVARLRLEGSCSDCSASAVTLELAIKQALEAGGSRSGRAGGRGHRSPARSRCPSRCPQRRRARVGRRRPPRPAADGKLVVSAEVAGAELVVANVGGTLLAYRDCCAACGGALHAGELVDGALHCPHCSRMYFLPRAGRSMDADHLQLDPVPLLRDRDSVRVAVAT